MRETLYDDSKYSVLAPSTKSIIEEWRNPPKYTEDLLRSDRAYEERAVDVVIDHRPQDFTKRLSQRSPPSVKVANDDVKSNDDKLIKIKRLQGDTVRSIPIKDYQASIAHNMGTLRRSVAPQSQFESLVSEPERGVYSPLKRRIPVTSIDNFHHRTPSQITCTASQFEYQGNAPRKLLCHFCDNQHDCYCVDKNAIDRNTEDNQYFNKTEEHESLDGSDVDEYFHRSFRRRFEPKDGRSSKRACVSSRRNATTVAVTDRENEKAVKASQLGESHVGQKISAYEQNVRRSLSGANPKYRSVFEVKGHRTIGVPLVGMHNACGLPVVATWQNHEILDPLRVSRKMVGTIRPIYRRTSTLPNGRRRRNQPKRKAPQPDRAMIIARELDRNVKRSTTKSVTHLDAIDGELSKKRHRRSSFTTSKVGSLSSKNSFKKRTARSSRKYGIKASSLVDTFGRKSVKMSNAKRATLYAKDNGEEAVQVLKNLCLNPLARTNPETDMMW